MRVQLNNFVARMITVSLVLVIMGGVTLPQAKHSVVPKGGFVPDQETAVKIAEAVLTPIYGVEKTSQEKPFVAELKGGVWLVSGTFHPDPSGAISKGGVAIVEISKADGKILRVSHGK
jgi:NTF2 fold immunity protein of polymorphic toxin system component